MAGPPLLLMLLLAGPLGPGRAMAQSPQETHAPSPEPDARADDSSQRLGEAVRWYQTGQHDLALSLLIALLDEAPTDPDLRREARIYIGEIFFVQGDKDASREAFELVLRDDPTHALDPFRHPPEVCAFFALIRESGSWRSPDLTVPVEPARRRPSPWLPLGIAQVRQGRTAAGVGQALIQGTSCGLSLGLGAWLLFDRRYGTNGLPGFDDEGHRLWVEETLESRRIVQLSATGACYGAYGIGVADAALAERRARRRATDTTADGAQVGSGPGLVLRLSRSF